jgi:hypothetical protein
MTRLVLEAARRGFQAERAAAEDGAPSETQLLAGYVNRRGPSGRTALMLAVEAPARPAVGPGDSADDRGERDAVDAMLLRLLAGEEDEDDEDAVDCGPLLEAEGDGELLRMLLDAGADVWAEDDEGKTVLMHAVAASRVDELLVETLAPYLGQDGGRRPVCND